MFRKIIIKPLTILCNSIKKIKVEHKKLLNKSKNISQTMSSITKLDENVEPAMENHFKRAADSESLENIHSIEAKKPKLEEPLSKTITSKPEGFVRIKLKKVALLLGYSGTGYYGMQKNPGVITIEDELLNALHKVNLIQEEHRDVPQTMLFQRAARTDKGVSAKRQVVSLKLPIRDKDDNYLKDIELINQNLPPQIRVFGIKRVTKSFNAKNNCDHRTYSYMTPTFAFAPETVTNLDETYRITEEQIKAVNAFLNHYQGNHNFHNFTAGRKADDASCNRYMVICECSEPFIKDDLEFVQLTFKGQSFMLHQIRKMVGLTVAFIRGFATKETLKKTWAPERVDIPIAPGLGLMLEFVHYQRYDKVYGGDGFHEKLEWDEHQKEINQFSNDYIIPTIVKEEKENKSMLNWMELLPLHSYDVREAGENAQTREKDTEIASKMHEEEGNSQVKEIISVQ